MSKRALRRNHRARIIARARHITRRWFSSWEPWQHEYIRGQGRVFLRKEVDHSEADAHAVKFADNMAACSCPGCGNPRRHHGQPRVRPGMGFRNESLTMQERRSVLDWLDWEEELGNPSMDDPST